MPRMPILAIQPTQLYISAEKLRTSERLFENNGFDEYEPVPVKRIGNDLFFTDGHTRALLLWRNGIESIEYVEDTDDLDWIMYLVDLQWCYTEEIRTIADLDNRIVGPEDYQHLWRDRCAEKHDRLGAEPLADLEIYFTENENQKVDICREILEALPMWFGIEEATQEYIEEVRELPFVVLSLYEKPVGFCAIKIHHRINCDLFVLGVFPEFHRRGIGKRMVDFIEAFCSREGIPFMTVKTLSTSHPDKNYAKTRRFYEACGFRQFEDFPTLWGEANPCLYMIKPVEKRRRTCV